MLCSWPWLGQSDSFFSVVIRCYSNLDNWEGEMVTLLIKRRKTRSSSGKCRNKRVVLRGLYREILEKTGKNKICEAVIGGL